MMCMPKPRKNWILREVSYKILANLCNSLQSVLGKRRLFKNILKINLNAVNISAVKLS